MLAKPGHVFDREREWAQLTRFAAQPEPGAKLGLVYGRRRQGKTFLLASLVEAAGGFLFGATQQSSAQNLRAFSDSYARYLNRPSTYFPDWDAAIDALWRLGEESDRPLPVVIDEFSYLADSVPGIASVIQIAMDPGHWAHANSRVRLILCGSALASMRNLLGGTAPLRGRAQVSMTVHPFEYRDAAQFWQVEDDPELAFRINALLGGTPAYQAMVGETPTGLADFDSWVQRKLLDPNEIIYTEGAVLLHQQPEFADPALYFSVLAAISRGAHRNSEIAAALERPANAIGHPLAVLESVRFIERSEDALRAHRPTYTIAEPAIRWHQLVIAPNEAPPWPSAPPSGSGTPPHPPSQARSTDRTSRPSLEPGPSPMPPRTLSADNPPPSGQPPSPAASIAPGTRSTLSPARRNPSQATACWPSARPSPLPNPLETASWTASNTYAAFCPPTRTAARLGCSSSAAPASPANCAPPRPVAPTSN